MITLHIEHAVRDYDRWKAAFDSDPGDRARSGVRRYVISRETEDPSRVTIDLEFDDLADARRMLATLGEVWRTPTAHGAVDGGIRTTILEQIEARRLPSGDA